MTCVPSVGYRRVVVAALILRNVSVRLLAVGMLSVPVLHMVWVSVR
jgi:hypothetical protein